MLLGLIDKIEERASCCKQLHIDYVFEQSLSQPLPECSVLQLGISVSQSATNDKVGRIKKLNKENHEIQKRKR